MTTVLKLGGSVVTEKDEPETVDRENLRRAADALAKSDEELVVIHGGGSFGHHHAAEHGVSTTDGTHDTEAVRAIHGAMKDLNEAVVDALAVAGVSAVPVHPFSAASRNSAGDLSLPTDQLATMLDEGFTPVLHGDVVVHETAGATILSGDELVVALADALDADRVGVCSAVPGVYDADENVIDRIDAFGDVADALGGSDATDVTGGMAAKVRELLGLAAPAYVFDIDGLDEFIAGEHPGTRID
ncbi:isopentenyl phosphate kinase family protein [Natronomonas halophila]|uniref:isopentenyl phosphate kinase n=1 Tax=Natronomonas halophila TaxID=2747817 RepID=UPI0015B74060|nr:isopentenyl phosphate kinase [Natronomonas halophila]QLD84151.1 isopentenyl phosphate kinase family protein [Natronomonas halophila]